LKIASLLGIVFVIVLVISLGAIWFYPSIQDFMAGNTMWNGIRDFSTELDVKDIDSLDDLTGRPEKDILICIPYIAYDENDLARLKEFVEKGGTLIMMDDFGYGNGFLEYIGINARFSGNIILDPLFCYKNQYLPRITDFSAGIKESGVTVIGLNHATTLSNVDDSEALASSSNTSFLDINDNGTRDKDELKGPFVIAAGYRVGRGTLELVADPSLIINTMVGKNDNYSFMKYLMFSNGEPENVLLDRSHLTKSPLDTSKINLTAARAIISNPYALVGVTAVVFAIITKYTFKRGLIIG
jgi:hypothetical protein